MSSGSPTRCKEIRLSLHTAVKAADFVTGPYAQGPIPFQTIVEETCRLGFEGISLAGFPAGTSPDTHPSEKQREGIVDLLDKHGLGVSEYIPDLSDCVPIFRNEKQRERYLDLLKKHLDFCVDVGAKKMRVDTGILSVSDLAVPYHAAWDRLVSVWRQAAELAASRNVCLAWEFEPGFIFNKPREILKLVEAIDNPAFKTMFDTCHAYMCAVVGAKQPPPTETLAGGVVELAEMLHGRIGAVHIIDSDGTLHHDWTSKHVPPGRGTIDFGRVVPAIIDAGYLDDWWTLDLCFWPNAWDELQGAKSFLDGIKRRFDIYGCVK